MLNAAQGFVYNKFQKPNDWPKIEDTFDYKYDNGKLIGGNKNLFLSGPVTYEKVGNPTVVDGIASGFTATQYIFANSVLDTSQDFEIFTKIKTGSVFNDYNTVFKSSYGINPGATGFTIGISNNTKKFSSYIIDSNGTNIANGAIGQTKFQTNTDYIIMFEQKGYTINLYCSSDYGETWILENTWTSSAKIRSSGQGVSFGGGNHSLTNQYLRGSIDLNHTYIKVNGRLWFYGKNYTTSNMVPVPKGLEYNNTIAPSNGLVYTNSDLVKGPVNYTVVGNPTIVNGVYINDDPDDTTNIVRTSTGASSVVTITTGFEYFLKLKLSQDATGTGYFITGPGNYLPNIRVVENLLQVRYFSQFTFASGETIDVASLEKGTYYYVRVLIDSTGCKCYLGTTKDNMQLTAQSTTPCSLQKTLTSTDYVLFGRDGGLVFQGAIDLNETYIKVNGQSWFGNVSRFQEFIPAPEEAQIGKDDTHNLVVETPIIKGQVDYEVVGSPTIENGIVSDFSSSNYLQVNSLFPNLDNIEGQVKFTTVSQTGQQHVIFQARRMFNIDVWSEIKISTYNWTTNTENTIVPASDYTVGATYIVKFKSSPSQAADRVNVSFSYSKNGGDFSTPVTYELLKSQDTEITLGNSSVQTSYDFGGSIDLNETYIKVNGQYWFKPKTELLSPKTIGQVGYEAVGSPTIIDGIANGFSASDYIKTTTSVNFLQITEIVTKINIPSTALNQSRYMSVIYGGMQFFVYSDTSNFTYCGFNANGIGDLRIQHSLAPDKNYWIKYTSDGTNSTAWWSEDGLNYTAGQTKLTSAITSNPGVLRFGSNGGNRYFDGLIDLNETYIKVNGKLWFGKEDWTPSTHTDNAIYLLGSHNIDYSTYNTQGINPTIETESDESGIYNVWIDNQEIYKEQSNPLDINWSNLALTTGYDITTPSTLKAHIIKVEPNNGNITRFSADTNYKVENGLLTWASPKLYLEGPTQYTIVGNPTIVNGIASGFSVNDYLTTSQSVPNSSAQIIDEQLSFTTGTVGTQQMPIGGDYGAGNLGFEISSNSNNNKILYRVTYKDESNVTKYGEVVANYELVQNTKYIARGILDCNAKSMSITLMDANGTVLTNASKILSSFYSLDSVGNIFLGNHWQRGIFTGSIDLNETYIKINNELWFGKIYTSETDVPVPTNFTYGNTTTSSNGTVNLTTQEFSADTLATYGKDS